MRTPVINVLAGLVIGASVAVLVALSAPVPVVGRAYPVPSQVQEDAPGWDCATMGNRVCGPVRPAGTADAYGCYWFADGPAWVSDRTPDGLCHDGPHGVPYWATGAYSGNDVLRHGTAAQVASWGWRQGFDVAPVGCN